MQSELWSLGWTQFWRSVIPSRVHFLSRGFSAGSRRAATGISSPEMSMPSENQAHGTERGRAIRLSADDRHDFLTAWLEVHGAAGQRLRNLLERWDGCGAWWYLQPEKTEEGENTTALTAALHVASSATGYKLHLFSLANPQSADFLLRRALPPGDVAAGRRGVMFAALDASLLPVAAAYFDDAGLTDSWTEPCGMFAWDTQPDQLGNEDVTRLTVEDAELINEHWTYKSETSLELVRHLLRAGAGGWGARVQGRLASWCLFYEDGAWGMMHTLEAYRRRGLGRRLVAAMLREAQKDDAQLRKKPFCFIVEGNTASERLFTSLGFRHVARVAWTGARPRKVEAD
ncbi:hypothetical protein CYMTET_19216 [Cymbomonas tetramitiformis]|uniref:N-acetyltransferase domain-containing protein n=1 Tax=Cymbomonas tetramitiformis TaxID=36881 RepID=A0AAE0G6I8_9CHLO|nr:hypothetical protein CYMTET_19216 [Cymbomonas tetramitiformis]